MKRLRSAPVPTATFLSGYLINSILTSALLAALVATLGRVVYGVPLPSAHILAAAVTVLVGAFACCALAFAITVPIRKATTATALVPAITLTLFFLSGNFFSLEAAPAGLERWRMSSRSGTSTRRWSPRSTRTSPAAGSPSSTSASWPCGGSPGWLSRPGSSGGPRRATSEQALTRRVTAAPAVRHPRCRPATPALNTARANARSKWLDSALYFCTGPDERKAKNLARNPRCILTTGCNGLDGLDLVVEGQAEKVSDSAELQSVADTFESKYGAHFTALRVPGLASVTPYGGTKSSCSGWHH